MNKDNTQIITNELSLEKRSSFPGNLINYTVLVLGVLVASIMMAPTPDALSLFFVVGAGLCIAVPLTLILNRTRIRISNLWGRFLASLVLGLLATVVGVIIIQLIGYFM